MNLGFSEMLFLFFLALIIFGPKRLPEIGRQVGRALAEFRRASNEFKLQLESEMRQIEMEQTLQKQKEQEAADRQRVRPSEAVSAAELPPAPVGSETPLGDAVPGTREVSNS